MLTAGNHLDDCNLSDQCDDVLYKMSGRFYTYDELVDALNAEAATLPPDTWRDGVWNVIDYIIEAGQVGIIETVFSE
ncbi:hypothetical protein PDG61_30480 [Mycolicibacterium sp. BiH015]|uniref:hypothetical protein n=1 Tax=Mycolicibacterium sp. BiH015 TaxID=3018808 RepID=UPI0022E40BF8|nr:hypothetical protein [Mycolicibacterium sp. BiH015]MDA2895271.1 hypothetical protein [Mycolicibacterium sp. BiH015]